MGSNYRSKANNSSSYGQYQMWMSQAYAADRASLKQSEEAFTSGIGAMTSKVRPPQKAIDSQKNDSTLRFEKVLNKKGLSAHAGYEVDGVIIDLETGKEEAYGVPHSTRNCASTLLIDVKRRRIIRGRKQIALGCKFKQSIEAYGFGTAK